MISFSFQKTHSFSQQTLMTIDIASRWGGKEMLTVSVLRVFAEIEK